MQQTTSHLTRDHVIQVIHGKVREKEDGSFVVCFWHDNGTGKKRYEHSITQSLALQLGGDGKSANVPFDTHLCVVSTRRKITKRQLPREERKEKIGAAAENESKKQPLTNGNGKANNKRHHKKKFRARRSGNGGGGGCRR